MISLLYYFNIKYMIKIRKAQTRFIYLINRNMNQRYRDAEQHKYNFFFKYNYSRDNK